MAVLCEAISVVAKAESIVRAFGSFDAFKVIVPNKTLCADNEIVRVGFMTPDDVKSFISSLEAKGLRYLGNGTAVDIVVIDQLRGPTVPCDWVEFGHVEISGDRIAAARLVGGALKKVITPPDWKFKGSLSQTYGFVPTGAEGRSLKFLRRERGLDVYLNRLTGREVFIGRSGDVP